MPVRVDAPMNWIHMDRPSGDKHNYRALAAFCPIKERVV